MDKIMYKTENAIFEWIKPDVLERLQNG